MITLEILGKKIQMTDENEFAVKKFLNSFSPDTKVTVLDTGEVLQINDIFNYD